MKTFLRWFFVLGLVIGSVVFLLAYDFYISPQMNTEKVLVLNEDKAFADEITVDDISVKNVSQDNIVDGALREDQLQLLNNTRATVDLKAGTQMYEGLIDNYRLVPDSDEGEFIAPIPEDWLYAVPGTLRQAFIADFYLIADDESVNIDRLIEDAENAGEEDVAEGEDVEEGDIDDLSQEEQENVDSVIEQTREPILRNIRVASVRDSSNAEVMTTEDGSEASTGAISELEIIADDDILETLQSYVDDGYQLYVVYRHDMTETENDETNEGDDES